MRKTVAPALLRKSRRLSMCGVYQAVKSFAVFTAHARIQVMHPVSSLALVRRVRKFSTNPDQYSGQRQCEQIARCLARSARKILRIFFIGLAEAPHTAACYAQNLNSLALDIAC